VKALPKTIELIKEAWDEIKPYEGRITLRQVYYRLLSTGVIVEPEYQGPMPEKTPAYRKLTNALANARQGKYDNINLPRGCLADNTRPILERYFWNSIDDYYEWVRKQYRTDWWYDQPEYIGIWVEKDALRASFEPICDEYGVPLIIGRGWSSVPLIDRIDSRFPHPRMRLLYFGDFDADGIGMAEDAKDRIRCIVETQALTEDQIEDYPSILMRKPKEKNYRGQKYVKRYGMQKWEIEAIPPMDLEQMLRNAIESHCDLDRLKQSQETDAEDIDKLDLTVRTIKIISNISSTTDAWYKK